MKKAVKMAVVFILVALVSLSLESTKEMLQTPKGVGRIAEASRKEPGAQVSGSESRGEGEDPFTSYSKLSAKALLSSREWMLLREQLSSPELIAEAKEALLAPPAQDPITPGVPDPVQERDRLCRVRYLAQAMGWTRNPARDLAIEAASEVIQRDVSAVDVPLMLKKSIAGDQIELYQALAVAAPSKANEVREQTRGSHAQRLIDFAVSQQMRRM
jgi:hypothetical protein